MNLSAAPQVPRDVALVCMTGEVLRAPKSLLSDASPYLKNVLEKCSSPVLVMPDVSLGEMVDLLEFLRGDGPVQLEGRILEIAKRYSIKTRSPKMKVTSPKSSAPYLPFKKRRLELTPPSSPESFPPQDAPVHYPSPLRETAHPVSAPVSPARSSSSPPLDSSPASPEVEPRVVTPPALSPSALQGHIGAFPLLPFLLQSSMLARSGMFQAAPAFPHLMASPQAQFQTAALLGQTSPVMPLMSPHETPTSVNSSPGTPVSILPRPFAQPQSPAASVFSGRTNSPQSLVPCEDCGKSFTVHNLSNHRRRNHRQLQEPVVCCGEQFPTRWHLRLHRRSINHRRTHWQPALSTSHADDSRPLSPTNSD